MKDKARVTRLIYGIFLSVFTVVMGVLFIVQSQRIYHSADISPYSYEKAKQYLSQIAVPFFLWIAAVIAGWVLWEIFPAEKKKAKAPLDTTVLLKRLKRRLPDQNAQTDFLKKADLIKKIVWGICIAFCLLSAVIVAVCVWNKDNYTPIGVGFDPTQDMLEMLPKILPWILISFVLAAGATVYEQLSAKREAEEVKKLLSSGTVKTNTANKKSDQKIKLPALFRHTYFRYAVQGALLVVGIVFVVAGCLNGGVKDVLEKAINICTECIGLG